jgi:hypothetical protein
LRVENGVHRAHSARTDAATSRRDCPTKSRRTSPRTDGTHRQAHDGPGPAFFRGGERMCIQRINAVVGTIVCGAGVLWAAVLVGTAYADGGGRL